MKKSTSSRVSLRSFVFWFCFVRVPFFLLSRFRPSLANTNYTVSNPCMSVSRSLIILSLFHLKILCSYHLPLSFGCNLSCVLLAPPRPSVCYFMYTLLARLIPSHLSLSLCILFWFNTSFHFFLPSFLHCIDRLLYKCYLLCFDTACTSILFLYCFLLLYVHIFYMAS